MSRATSSNLTLTMTEYTIFLPKAMFKCLGTVQYSCQYLNYYCGGIRVANPDPHHFVMLDPVPNSYSD